MREVVLKFVLLEDVTPELFAGKVAFACSGGALRPGEMVVEPASGKTFVVTDQPVELPWKTEEFKGAPKPKEK